VTPDFRRSAKGETEEPWLNLSGTPAGNDDQPTVGLA
jgi:hypothetical protein